MIFMVDNGFFFLRAARVGIPGSVGEGPGVVGSAGVTQQRVLFITN
ncbi:hypothetical protein HMPREF0290_2466 [Corynebacterium efficiens YS-314]|nr:hypothetical protein HMPREF0290_2466 [Corynebacterium efficiens YS-314]